jgi:hypothetical protein
MKKVVLVVSLMYFSFASFSQHVSVNFAKKTAQKFLQAKKVDNSVKKLLFSGKLEQDTTSAFYLFSLKPEGFIIIAADKKVKPVLAYSFKGDYSNPVFTSAIRDVFDTYSKGITEIVKSQYAKTLKKLWENPALMKKGTKSVEPLVATTWDQMPYYNYLCPDNCPTGCVTTATAQIMKYYEHPVRGNGYHSYESANYGTLSSNFGASVYDWANMPIKLTSSSSSTEKMAVAKLMYDVAVALEVDFTPEESNTYPNLVADVLSNYFSYSTQAQFVKRSNYSLTTWINMLKNELDNNRVMLYTGFDSEHEVGHAFVMDGYDDNGLFHINWGWSGWYDGYFEINDLSPISSYSFNETQGAVIKIIPVDTYTDVKLFGDIQLSSQTVSYDDELLVGVDVANYGNQQFYGDFKASLFDTNDVFVTDIEVLQNQSVNAGDYSSLTFYTSNIVVVPGVYKLGIYFRNDGDENWTLVDEDEFSNPVTINVANNDTSGLITSSNILVDPDPVQESNPVTLEFNVNNNSQDDFYGEVGIWLHELNGELVYHVHDTLVYISAGEDLNLVFHDTISDVMGTYKLVLWYHKNGESWHPVGSVSYPNFKQVDVILTDAFSLPPDSFENNNHLEDAYNIPENWEDDLATFETGYANIHSAYDDSADYYKFRLLPGYNYSIYAYVLDSYVDTNYTNDVIFKVKLSTDSLWSQYYDDDDMGVIDFDNINDTVYFYVCVNPFFIGNLGTYDLNLMVERTLITADETVNNSEITIFPNPASDFVFIKGLTLDKYKLELFSYDGKALPIVVAEDGKIDLNGIKKGVYFLKIFNNNEQITKKIVKL